MQKNEQKIAQKISLKNTLFFTPEMSKMSKIVTFWKNGIFGLKKSEIYLWWEHDQKFDPFFCVFSVLKFFEMGHFRVPTQECHFWTLFWHFFEHFFWHFFCRFLGCFFRVSEFLPQKIENLPMVRTRSKIGHFFSIFEIKKIGNFFFCDFSVGLFWPFFVL